MEATIVKARAKKAGVADRVQSHRCTPDNLDLSEQADFALAFWMAHEVPDIRSFFDQIYALLRDGGRFLLVEPKGHVGQEKFQREVEAAQSAGFSVQESPKIAISRAALFTTTSEKSE